jgi:hypothetical protein
MAMQIFGIMNTDASNEDWKTALAHEQRNIMKGEKVEIIDTYYRNFYGSYYRVKTKDSGMYYVNKSAVTLL